MAKYKTGDKVTVKSKEWYLENRDDGIKKWVNLPDGNIFGLAKSKYCGRVMTIENVCSDGDYILVEDVDKMHWSDYMFEDEVISDYQRGYNDAVEKAKNWIQVNIIDDYQHLIWKECVDEFLRDMKVI